MTQPLPAFPVLIDQDSVERRIHELVTIIAKRYFEVEPPLLVAVLEGARRFADQLTRRLPGRPRWHGIRASSYGENTLSSGSVKVLVTRDLPVRNRQVLLIEDVVDTGRTVHALQQWFMDQGAASFDVVALLNKSSRRVVEVEIAHVGFEIADHFVIGYGLDVAGRFRELPHIAVYDAALEAAG